MSVNNMFQSMTKSDAINLIATLTAVVIGDEHFANSTPDFKKMVVHGAELFVTFQKATVSADAIDAEPVAKDINLIDCKNLGTVIYQLQQAQIDLCPPIV